MKHIVKLIVTIGLLFLIPSCQDDLEGINQSPNIFTEVEGEIQVGTAQLSMIKTASSDISRYAAVFAGQAEGTQNQWVTINTYDVTADDFSGLWEDAYQEGVTQAKEVVTKAEQADLTQLQGVALIMEAYHLGEMASLFGDVPNVEAGDLANFPNPAYDSQQSVFEDVQNKLTTAIGLLGTTASSVYATGLTSSSTWAEIAHALKARYYLNAKDYPNALTEAQNSIASAGAGLYSTHGTSNGNQNMWYAFDVERQDNIMGENAYLYDLLDSDNATYERVLASPGEDERFNYYFDDSNNPSRINFTNNGVFAETRGFPIISWYEVKLIEAEAAHRNGGDGLTPLNEVRAQLETDYAVAGGFPASTSSGADLLMEIMEEKYITLFGSTQAFLDLMRTNNLIGVPANTGSQLPQRFLYPQSEINANSSVPNPRPGLFDPTPVNQ